MFQITNNILGEIGFHSVGSEDINIQWGVINVQLVVQGVGVG